MNENQPYTTNDEIEKRLRSLSKRLNENLSLSDRVLLELDKKEQGSVTEDDLHPRFSTSFGEMTMFQKLSAASIAASTVLVTVLWLVSSAGSTSFAQVVDNIRKATSYQADVRMEVKDQKASEGPMMTGKYYWRSPMDVRMENRQPGGRESVNIYFQKREGIELDRKRKTFRMVPARSGVTSPIMQLQKLPELSGIAEKQLGEKAVQGRILDGFSIAISDVDESAGDGTLTVWVNRKTQLPDSVEMQMNMPQSIVMVLENIVWNRQLAESLFSTEPPEGYTRKEQTRSRTDAQKLASITEALKAFAELNDGKYPQVKVIYGDVAQAKMIELAGLSDLAIENQLRDKRFLKIREYTRGWATMNEIMRENPSAEYRGLDVDPDDSKEVLFRWTKPNGSVQVIYGDLRTATLSQ